MQRNLPGIPKTKKAETVEVKQKPEQVSKPNDSSETAESICLNLKLEENQEQTTEQKLFDYISKLPPSQIRYIVDSYYKNVYPNLIDFNLWKYGEDKLGDGLKDILIEIKNIAAKEEKYQIPETFSFISRLRDLY